MTYIAVFRDGPMGGGDEDRMVVTVTDPPKEQWFAPAPARGSEPRPVRSDDACDECNWSDGHAWTCSRVAHLSPPDLRWMKVGDSAVGGPDSPWPHQVKYELQAIEGDRAYYTIPRAIFPALTQYVIYEHPNDHPDKWVVRAWSIGAGRLEAGPIIAIENDLDAAREKIPDGMVNVGRFPDDLAVVHEVWT